MAHEIDTTVKANGSLYLRNSVAWHGLGTVVEKDVNLLEIPDLIGINWNVVKKPLFYNSQNVQGVNDLGELTYEQNMVESHVATVRMDTGSQLGIVGKDYEVIQNEEIFHWSKAFGEFGNVIVETSGSIFAGRNVWALLRMDGMGFDFGGGDKVNPYLLISTSHDGSKTLTIVPTAVRVVCANTMSLALKANSQGRKKNGLEHGWKLSHTKNVRNRMEDAKKMILRTHESFEATKEQIQSLANTRCDIDILNDITAKVWTVDTLEKDKETSKRAQSIQENRLQEIKQLWKSPTNQTTFAANNLWGAFNSITEYIDHHNTIRVTEGKDAKEQRFFSTQFGNGSVLKANAWKETLALV